MKSKLLLFDKLIKESKENDKTFWKGEKGKYLFVSTGVFEKNRPITKIFLNRTYLTGLFRTKNKDIFSGDIKEIDKKTYLMFKVVSSDNIEIYKKS